MKRVFQSLDLLRAQMVACFRKYSSDAVLITLSRDFCKLVDASMQDRIHGSPQNAHASKGASYFIEDLLF